MKYILSVSIAVFLSLLLLNCSKKQDNPQSIDGWGFVNNTESYDIGKEDEMYNGEPVYYLRSNRKVTTDFGAIAKNISPEPYIGKRIKLTGYIKTEDVENSAGMWMRIDSTWGAGAYYKMLSFDNMMNRPIKGTTGWNRYEIVLDVPPGSKIIYCGAHLNDNGELWLSGFRLDTAGTDVPTTGKDIKK